MSEEKPATAPHDEAGEAVEVPRPTWLPAELGRPGPLAALTVQPTERDVAREGGALASKGAAALAMCWPENTPWPVRPPPIRWRVGQDVLEYGQGVFDRLVDGGLPLAEVLNAGTLALTHSRAVLVPTQEVRTVQGFSGGPAPVSAPSSSSAESTASR
jgi:hypothetical protein